METTSNDDGSKERSMPLSAPEMMTMLLEHVENWKEARNRVQHEAERINILRAELKETSGISLSLDDFDGVGSEPQPIVMSITPERPAAVEDEEDVEIPEAQPESVDVRSAEQIRKEALGDNVQAPLETITQGDVVTKLDRAMAVGFAQADKKATNNRINPNFFGNFGG